MEVVEKSPLETSPACPHFGKCGGCTYQTVAYEEQLKIKSAQVEKLLSEVVSGELTFESSLKDSRVSRLFQVIIIRFLLKIKCSRCFRIRFNPFDYNIKRM